MKIRFTSSARAVFLSGLQYIHRESPQAAQKIRIQVERSLKRVASSPRSGRKIPEFPELEHREILVHPFRLFYRIHEKELWIVAVWHHAQIPSSPNRR